MKTTVHHVGYGTIEYTENVWTGRKELWIGGKRLSQKKKNIFRLNNASGSFDCLVKGSALTGATLHVDKDIIPLSPPPKWYEALSSISIFLVVLIWGNSTSLATAFFPIVGGAIGGAISGLTAFLCLFLMKNVKSIWLKLLIWAGLLFATVLVCYLIAALILSLV